MVIIGSLENIVRYPASQPGHPKEVAVRRRGFPSQSKI
jgi:hypothetical protein